MKTFSSPRFVSSSDQSKGLMLKCKKDGNSIIYVWDFKSGKTLIRVDVPGLFSEAFFSPTENKLVLIEDTDDNSIIYVWDVEAGEELFSAQLFGLFSEAFFSPTENKLVLYEVGSSATMIHLFDVRTGKMIQFRCGPMDCIKSGDGDGKTIGRFSLNEEKLFCVDGNEILSIDTSTKDDESFKIDDASSITELSSVGCISNEKLFIYTKNQFDEEVIVVRDIMNLGTPLYSIKPPTITEDVVFQDKWISANKSKLLLFLTRYENGRKKLDAWDIDTGELFTRTIIRSVF